MAGELKINNVSVATESGGTVTINNATLGNSMVLGTTSSPIANNLVFANGNGIDFSAAAGSAAGSSSAVLNDYEEGTWTPTFVNVTLGNGSVSGNYKKIGDLVFVSAKYVHGSTSSVSGGIYINNLPFTTANFTFSGIGFANYPGSDQYQIRATIGAPPSTQLYVLLIQSTS